jgi:GDP-4-dehydro-6-deoxy-D-mannose reductase
LHKTILITGVTSCTGLHAVSYLASTPDVILHGAARRSISLEGLSDCHTCDFRYAEDIDRIVSNIQPDQVVHLAASSDSSKPDEMLQINVSGTWHLLEACRRLQKPVEVMLVGSAASFGEMRPGEQHLSGGRVCEPGSLYGLSRHTQLEVGRIADGLDGLRVFLCRTFNLIGPGISDRYVPAALAKRIAFAAEEGLSELAVRDLDAVRDFIDVRDAVAAYVAIMQKGRSGYPYSVGRGEPVTIRQLCDVLTKEQDTRIRFADDSFHSGETRSGVKRSMADPSDLMNETGWSPRYTLAQSVRDMLSHSPSPSL